MIFLTNYGFKCSDFITIPFKIFSFCSLFRTFLRHLKFIMVASIREVDTTMIWPFENDTSVIIKNWQGEVSKPANYGMLLQ